MYLPNSVIGTIGRTFFERGEKELKRAPIISSHSGQVKKKKSEEKLFFKPDFSKILISI